MSTSNVKEVVREKYGQAALRAKSEAGNCCCSGASTLEKSCDPITSNLYDARQKDEVPDTAINASLGCGNPPAEIKKNMELWVGCVAGALSDYDYVAKLAKAGFNNIDIEATRVYNIDDARAFLSNRGLNVDKLAKEVEGKFISAFVRA